MSASQALLSRRHGAVPLVLLGFLLLGLGAVPARAATGAWVADRSVRARLVAASDAAGDGAITAGLQVALDDGWDTYWRSPGDAGAAPAIDWSGSSNVAGVGWRWPAPTRFTLLGLETFGYTGEVLFPLTVHPAHPGEPVALRGGLDLLVCSNICVPKHLALSLDLPAGAPSADADAANLIARYEARVPVAGDRAGLAVTGAALRSGTPATLAVRLAAREPLGDGLDVIVESDKWSFGKPVFSAASDRLSATAILPVTAGPDPVGMPGTPLTITATTGMAASEQAVTVGRAGGALGGGVDAGLLAAIAAALLGGLVLNLMPCVLPVLGLKLMAVLRHHGHARRRVRTGFLATASGIVASMLALGGVLIALRSAGLAIGWGLQFQHPAFLIVMTAALVIFAADLLGLFDLALPPRLATLLGAAGGDSLGGSFVAGAFTTALATPCSAPFVGTAVAFALARGPGEIAGIFAALGVGLAAPHLLVAAFPGAVHAMPRPGRWMLHVRRMLALLLAGSAAWLLSVLAAQTSWAAAGLVGIAALALAAALALRPRIGAPATGALAGLGILLAASAPLLLGAAVPSEAAVSTTWTPFDEAELRRDVAEGRTVFVDVTAAWCVNCKANETLVLDRPAVAAALAEPGIVRMRADWTRPDPHITDYLARNRRFGIPFNAVYGPGAPRGIVLSEVLSGEAVLGALRQAGAAPR